MMYYWLGSSERDPSFVMSLYLVQVVEYLPSDISLLLGCHNIMLRQTGLRHAPSSVFSSLLMEWDKSFCLLSKKNGSELGESFSRLTFPKPS